MKLSSKLVFSAALCLSWPAWVSAAPEVVLKGSQVNETALIDALAVDQPQGDVGATRGFKPANPNNPAPAVRTATAGTASGAAAAPPPGRASLLITFQSSSAALTGDSQAVLDKVASALQSDRLAGLTFRVEGHADVRGDPQANMKLSQQRAESVVQYLVDKHGILPERLSAHGKGSSEPLNKDRADAPENRRVTVVTNRS